MFSNCGHCFAYPQLPAQYIWRELSMNFLFLMTNSVACISVNLSRRNPSTSNSIKSLPCTNFVNASCNLHQIPTSRDVPFLWFLSRYQSSKSSPMSFHTAICFIFCNKQFLYFVSCLSFHHCLVCRMCQK